MQINLSGATWDALLDRVIEEYLTRGQSEMPFPNHSQCSFELPYVILRRDSQEIGRFEFLAINLSDQIHFETRDLTKYPEVRPVTNSTVWGRHAH
ncbi:MULTISPECIES: hypothetical protein [unclassified Caballeronia]|uniref:hypothetical protein n=1 Tax=unclassified Caballeronia TaxID=2646786 RepID=UPI00202844EB|nr:MULTISPECIES: hypothetical protein [unclassified Caballeronia]